MTNAEKFVEVFGTDLKRQYATKSWWDQEFVPPKTGQISYLEPDNCGNYVVNHETVTELQKSEEVTCKDTISRQEAIDAFSMFAEYESNLTNAEWVNRIRVVLSSLPPVTPMQKSCDDVLNKIKTEIEHLGNQLRYLDTREVLQIIDKYKTESEEK